MMIDVAVTHTYTSNFPASCYANHLCPDCGNVHTVQILIFLSASSSPCLYVCTLKCTFPSHHPIAATPCICFGCLDGSHILCINRGGLTTCRQLLDVELPTRRIHNPSRCETLVTFSHTLVCNLGTN